ncbi:hypothetical protein Trydic_g5401 [Trypoxylus dichotomus]
MYNTILNINSICDTNSFNVSILLEQPFNGIFFVRGFSQECRVFGNSSRSLVLNLSSNACGVRLEEDEVSQRLYYEVTVILQQDKFLRQISDENKLIKCYLPNNSFQVKSINVERTLKKLMFDGNRRKGRMKIDWNNETKTGVPNSTLSDTLQASRAWMEILPAKFNKNSGLLKVGEPVLLVVKSTLPAAIGWRVVDCVAHDGLGDSFQTLLDQNGCPIDEQLLPAFSKKPAKLIALMKHQQAVSKFAAFKFPDRDILHLRCNLQLCKNTCPQLDCSNVINARDNRFGRTLNKVDVLDNLKVFNSVEVRAPEIELQEDFVNFEVNYGKYTSAFGNIPGDRTFCISPSNMALSFCLVGLVLLCAILMTYTCIVQKSQKYEKEIIARGWTSGMSKDRYFSLKLAKKQMTFL